MIGAVVGATLLLVLPSSAFDAIVPALIALALVLVVAQPKLNASVDHRPQEGHPARLRGLVSACGVYGGYFGAAQGILLMGILGLAIEDTLQRLNGLKNVLAGLNNLTAGVIFVFAATVNWGVAGPDRRGLDHRRRAGSALRPAPVADRAAGADRDRRHRGDRAPPRRLTAAQAAASSQRNVL